MMKILLYLWFLNASLYAAKKPLMKPPLLGRLFARPEYFQECENASLFVHVLKPKIMSEGSVVVLSSDLLIDRWIYNTSKTIVRIQNCEDANVGTCQLFQTWRFGREGCRYLAMKKGAFWSPMVKNIHPDARCPLHPGTYTIENGTLDMDVLLRLPYPLERYYWRAQVECYDPNIFMCLDIGIRFLRTFV